MPESRPATSAAPDVVDIPQSVWASDQLSPFLARTGPRARADLLASCPKQGPHRGEPVVYLVGPEANRFVFLTGREHFSHDLGWTPVVGETLGHGLLNMDPPEHTRHRALMNPAFTDHVHGRVPAAHAAGHRRAHRRLGRHATRST